LFDCKEKYYDFFKNSRDALYITDRDGRFVDASQSFLDLFGYTRKELGNLKVQETYGNHSDRLKFQRAIERRGLVMDYAVRLRKKNGTELDCLITATVRRANNGSVLGYQGIIRDTTEHKRMVMEIRGNKKRYRELVDLLPTAVFEADESGNFIFVNHHGFKISGYTPEDIDKGLNALQLFLPEDRDRVKEDMRRVLSGEKLDGREYTGLRKDGSTYSVIQYSSPVIVDHRAVGVRGIVVDVTERKQVEQELLESRLRYRTLFENAPVGIGLATLDGHILAGNQAMYQMAGYSEADMGNLHVSDIYANPKDRKLLLRRLLRGEPVREFEARMKRKDGTPYDAGLTINRITVDGRDVILTIIRDITAHKEGEKKLLGYQKQLRSLASELSLAEERERRHIATYLHDHIGHGLAMCKIKLGLLQESLPPIHRDGYLDEIKGIIEQAIQCTRSLTSELSPPVLYEMGLVPAVEWLAENVSEQYSIQVTVKNTRQFKRLNGNLQILLFQAARELLTNIVKHAQAQKVKICIRRYKEDKIQIEVKDDGVGFDTSHLLSNITKNGGFGLFNIRERFNHLGGHLDIQSQPGCGTHVTIVAPLETTA
jgi:PAS domain S-box-containing protein